MGQKLLEKLPLKLPMLLLQIVKLLTKLVKLLTKPSKLLKVPSKLLKMKLPKLKHTYKKSRVVLDVHMEHYGGLTENFMKLRNTNLLPGEESPSKSPFNKSFF